MPGFITPPLLMQLQGISEGEMPDTFTVDVPGAFVPNGQGGGAYGLPTTRGPYPCRFGRAAANEVEIANRDQQDSAERITYPLAVALAAHEEGTGTISRTGDVFRFSVEAIIPAGTFAVSRKAEIKRLSHAP